MITVKQMLSEKGTDVWTISPDAKVFDAIKLMSEKSIGALVVAIEGRVVGVLSERDYARKIILMGKSSHDTPVRAIMTSKVYGIHLENTAEECLALMTDKRIRHLPVFDKQERLVGMISIGDVVKAVISQQKVDIEHLKDYIMGKC